MQKIDELSILQQARDFKPSVVYDIKLTDKIAAVLSEHPDCLAKRFLAKIANLENVEKQIEDIDKGIQAKEGPCTNESMLRFMKACELALKHQVPISNRFMELLLDKSGKPVFKEICAEIRSEYNSSKQPKNEDPESILVKTEDLRTRREYMKKMLAYGTAVGLGGLTTEVFIGGWKKSGANGQSSFDPKKVGRTAFWSSAAATSVFAGIDVLSIGNLFPFLEAITPIIENETGIHEHKLWPKGDNSRGSSR